MIMDRSARVQFLAEARYIYIFHSIQTGFAAHPASYTMGTRDSFPGVKVAGA
jgi:hypothetical protein